MFYSAPWGLIGPTKLGPIETSRTRAAWAYRYNGHFFRTFVGGHADIYNAGQYLANRIPNARENREKWIKQIIALIENELLWRAEHGIPIEGIVHPDRNVTEGFTWMSRIDMPLDHPVEDRTQIAFMDITPDFDLDWLCQRRSVMDWTYVIDLEDHAFTINGIIHFAFGRMPRDISKRLAHITTSSAYFQATTNALSYSTLVRRWSPIHRAPPESLVGSYDMISPILTNLEGWRTRGWDELNASESLSAHLVVTILRDQEPQIRNPDFLGDRRMFAHCQWQLVTATAPLAITMLPSLPPTDPRPQINISLDSRHPREVTFSLNRSSAAIDSWGAPPPMWFRGCLVILCHRLDRTEFVKAEVFRMVQNLNASHRNEGIGLIFDGQNVVGVALDGKSIRHSPALPVYNHQLRLMDGFRLMVHLLGPCLLTEKVPWRPSIPQSTRSPLPLPIEIIVRIIQFVGSDTYSILPLVSYTFRRLYFTCPRFGNFILLQATRGGAFHAFDTIDQQGCCVRFDRHMTDYHYSGFTFHHRQPKLGPTFFTPPEYAASLNASWLPHHRKHEMQVLHHPVMTHILRLGLQLRNIYISGSDEVLIPEEVEVTMQVVLGSWTIKKMKVPQDDKVWYWYHVARES